MYLSNKIDLGLPYILGVQKLTNGMIYWKNVVNIKLIIKEIKYFSETAYFNLLNYELNLKKKKL